MDPGLAGQRLDSVIGCYVIGERNSVHVKLRRVGRSADEHASVIDGSDAADLQPSGRDRRAVAIKPAGVGVVIIKHDEDVISVPSWRSGDQFGPARVGCSTEFSDGASFCVDGQHDGRLLIPGLNA